MVIKMKGRDKLGRFKKGVYQGHGFIKGNHPRTEFKVGHHSRTEFKEGHTLSQGEKNGMWIDGRSMRRKVPFARSY
jgi:hypothetical protein